MDDMGGVGTIQPTKASGDTYWADEDDPDILRGTLINRRLRFYQRLTMSGLYNRIRRNWDYYNNRYLGGSGAWQEIGRGGPEQSFSMIAVNHFRSILHMLITYTIQNRPAWDCRAIDSSDRALKQTQFATKLLDYYMEQKGVANILRRAVEHAIVLSAGFAKTCWDPAKGKLVNADPTSGQFEFDGDIHFDTPSIFEVIYDYAVRNWDDRSWTLIHSFRNKWDLAENPDYFQFRDDIIGLRSIQNDSNTTLYRSGLVTDSEDLIDFWEFFHKPTAAIPEGRYFAMAGDKVALTPEKLPYPYAAECEILHRIVPADILLSSFGYSPGFDLQGLQEAMNAEYSTIITNHNNLGPTKMWFKAGENINTWDWEPSTNMVQTDTKPEPLAMCQTPSEILQFPAVLTKEMEYVSGVNAVSRGQPDASYRSGAALALIDSKTNQFNSTLGAAFYSLLSSVGTSIIRILRKETGAVPRLAALAGGGSSVEIREFTAADLDAIDHVVVQPGNPMSRTIAGRIQIADTLMANGMLTTPEEYFTVLETGQLKPLTETLDAQNALIHQENELLRQGQAIEPSALDNILLHIKKHNAINDSVDFRLNSPAFINMQTHITGHIQQLMNPQVQALQIALRYATPAELQLVVQLSNPQPMQQPPAPKGKPGQAAPRQPEGNPNVAAQQPGVGAPAGPPQPGMGGPPQ